ncbi:50S ribosomal protein L35, chloroplastic-like [Zingiber officinale]|uniref:50S ribosomal protein L35, chloroplastic-like n=1 Tax=Zingiber officinale TaxID=94328 RepID=UPI001C4BD58B|nr:50S ribosomal protein L35, chloroplastic-like [Zingiber officinale]
MASFSLCFARPFAFSLPPFHSSNGLRLSSSHAVISLHRSLGSFTSISGSPLLLSRDPFPSPSSSGRPSAFAVFASKGYKMKTHKASAKRFRVTGRGKIVRRRAGKQHLLRKKNTKRKLRLSKMHPVNRSDYDNVIGALPYLKVNRKAT